MTITSEVTDAMRRLAGAEHQRELPTGPIVRPAPMPDVFRAIINNHNRQAEIVEKGPNMTQEDWRALGKLRLDFRDNLKPSAEKALSWNRDKGKTK